MKIFRYSSKAILGAGKKYPLSTSFTQYHPLLLDKTYWPINEDHCSNLNWSHNCNTDRPLDLPTKTAKINKTFTKNTRQSFFIQCNRMEVQSCQLEITYIDVLLGPILSRNLSDKTMNDTFMYIPNDDCQNYPFSNCWLTILDTSSL